MDLRAATPECANLKRCKSPVQAIDSCELDLPYRSVGLWQPECRRQPAIPSGKTSDLRALVLSGPLLSEATRRYNRSQNTFSP